MDFIKVFDQTVREIKREVNLKVLKVPEIEQKVLDATSDEPWGPHGTALSELAHATKKFAECQMVMNVLWTRLTERGSKWRHVYKALTIIEYLIANGSERAVDDILDHYSKISVLSSFEYVEPNGKDAGINVRKKVETILGILNDKERIKAVRDKASSNRDKYVGLSSTGITYKSSSASFGSNYSSGERYGSFSGTRESDSFGDSYRDRELVKTSTSNTGSQKSGSKLRKDAKPDRRNEDYNSPSSLKPPSNTNSNEDDFDDFDPRGSSSNGKANAKTSQVDLFGPNLMDDFIDVSAAAPATNNAVEPQVDLFADADFQSATASTETAAHPDVQDNVDLFAEKPTFAAAFPPQTGFIPPPSSGTSSEVNTSMSKNTTPEPFDPFGAVPLNSFDGSDPFGTFSSNVGSYTAPPPAQSSTAKISTSSQNLQAASDFGAFVSNSEEAAKDPFDISSSSIDGKTPLAAPKTDASDFGAFVSNTEEATKDPFVLSSSSNLGRIDQTPLAALKPNTKKENFQVKSGIWADSLSRGLIDLNITAPKKVNLADIGIVGGLGDGSEEKAAPSWTMGARSSLGMSGIPSSTQTGGIESLANYNKHQFGFK
ncbi:clathrin interactor EPSIN 1-like [Phragmites australis]|uniref:clathrin interactor EPSIN 1-like n=1 Tax=Phragmites australis TaxID=29695 RepID=UPI002D7996C9|nr:clathrin interactor EPSIN 1-like [Phragmites australis]